MKSWSWAPGAGGKLMAWHLARSGRKTAVVQRRWIGGSCPNIACLPSKNEIWSAKVAHLMHHAAQFGTVTGPVAIDMAKVRQRKRDMVDGLIDLHLQNYKASGLVSLWSDKEAGTGKKLIARAGAHDCLSTPVDYFRHRPPAPRSSPTPHHARFVSITH